MKHRVGILGGTFDPIHKGHLFLGRQAYINYNLDYVLFMPSGRPPHKSSAEISENVHRENMVKLAIAEYPYFRYSDLELKRAGIIYTADTLELLCQQNPDTGYYFILGADSLFSFESWKQPQRIFQLCEIIAAGRPELEEAVPSFQGDVFERMKAQILKLETKYHGRIHLMETSLMNISSTDIRQRIKHGQIAEDVLPESVAEYIIQHGLYKG